MNTCNAATIAQTLTHMQTLGLDRLEAQLLLLHVLGLTPRQRSWLLTHDTYVLSEPDATLLAQLTKRRLVGEPLAYLTGEQAFYGLRLQVNSHVLIPRPDTETLVQWALDVLSAADCTEPQILDLGTGSGAIALAIKSQRPDGCVYAVDASASALAQAKANADRLALQVTFRLGNWFAALPADNCRFDCVVANPPYIADQDPHLAALGHEPRQALTSGIDGLDDIRHIISHASNHLQPGGWLLLEHGYDQAGKVRDLLQQYGFGSIQSRRDLAGIERCSGGQLHKAK